ncbi:MAG: hypothetical protein Q8P46_06870 [Hyphomicrobiales bacterium]|nr:hypothetical protein [Hyphomicrobiales bacterium]
MTKENASGAPAPCDETWGEWAFSFKRHYEQFGFGIYRYAGLGIAVAKLGWHVAVLTCPVRR